MSHSRKLAQHSASDPLLNDHSPAMLPNRNHLSSPVTFFNDAMRRPRRNTGYPHLAIASMCGPVK